jgi:hypothetical protein
LVELLGEHLDAIDVSRAGKTVGRTIVLPANPGQLLTAPDGWTVSSVARLGRPPTMHAAYCDLRVDVEFFGRCSSGSRYDPIEPPGGKGLGPQTPASHGLAPRSPCDTGSSGRVAGRQRRNEKGVATIIAAGQLTSAHPGSNREFDMTLAPADLSLNPWIGRSSDRRVNSENAF